MATMSKLCTNRRSPPLLAADRSPPPGARQNLSEMPLETVLSHCAKSPSHALDRLPPSPDLPESPSTNAGHPCTSPELLELTPTPAVPPCHSRLPPLPEHPLRQAASFFPCAGQAHSHATRHQPPPVATPLSPSSSEPPDAGIHARVARAHAHHAMPRPMPTVVPSPSHMPAMPISTSPATCPPSPAPVATLQPHRNTAVRLPTAKDHHKTMPNLRTTMHNAVQCPYWR